MYIQKDTMKKQNFIKLIEESRHLQDGCNEIILKNNMENRDFITFICHYSMQEMFTAFKRKKGRKTDFHKRFIKKDVLDMVAQGKTKQTAINNENKLYLHFKIHNLKSLTQKQLKDLRIMVTDRYKNLWKDNGYLKVDKRQDEVDLTIIEDWIINKLYN